MQLVNPRGPLPFGEKRVVVTANNLKFFTPHFTCDHKHGFVTRDWIASFPCNTSFLLSAFYINIHKVRERVDGWLIKMHVWELHVTVVDIDCGMP